MLMDRRIAGLKLGLERVCLEHFGQQQARVLEQRELQESGLEPEPEPGSREQLYLRMHFASSAAEIVSINW